jgi:hypothetical protein
MNNPAPPAVKIDRGISYCSPLLQTSAALARMNDARPAAPSTHATSLATASCRGRVWRPEDHRHPIVGDHRVGDGDRRWCNNVTRGRRRSAYRNHGPWCPSRGALRAVPAAEGSLVRGADGCRFFAVYPFAAVCSAKRRRRRSNARSHTKLALADCSRRRVSSLDARSKAQHRHSCQQCAPTNLRHSTRPLLE